MARIGMHDHEVKKEPMYCTLMKEICHSGWTKSMGEIQTNDGASIRPRCHKWVSIFVKKGIEGPVSEVFDCNERMMTDLTQQVAQEVYQGAAATEQVRNTMAEQNGTSRLMLAFFKAIAERMRARIQLPEPPRPKTLEILKDDAKGESHDQ